MTKISNWQKIKKQIADVLFEGNIVKTRKLLEKINKLPKNLRGDHLRLGIVRTFTIETQLDFFKLAISMLPAKVEIKVADIENIEQELLDPKSDLISWKPDIVLVLWRLEEIIPQFYANPNIFSNKDYNNCMKKIKIRINHLTNNYTKLLNSPLILSTMPIPQIIDIHDINNTVSYRRLVEEINLLIFKCQSKFKKISIFDFNGWCSIYGKDSFDRKMDFFARQPISSEAIGSFASEIARTLRPFIFSPSKAIAIDADNVLWGGILGEDGINEIKIGHEYPGNIYWRIQEFILKLKQRGILLFLLSKNNIKDIKKIFSNIGYMPLKFNDFDSVKVNWKKKYINLKEIASDFNLGLDSFVFIDDQPFEREQMKYNLPNVNILEISEDPLTILSALENCWLFDQYSISQEDKIRSIDYTSEVKRKSLKQSINNTEKFLKTLKLKAIVSLLNKKNTYRATQMLAKTNQFNLRTKRHSESKLSKIINDSNNISLTLSLSDQFGDQGIIGLIIGLAKNNRTLFIDSFLLSCRALGRGAEKVLWYVFIQQAIKKNITNIKAEYICTQKNSQVSELFDSLGMNCINKNKTNTLYKLSLPLRIKKPNWIKIVMNTK